MSKLWTDKKRDKEFKRIRKWHSSKAIYKARNRKRAARAIKRYDKTYDGNLQTLLKIKRRKKEKEEMRRDT